MTTTAPTRNPRTSGELHYAGHVDIPSGTQMLAPYSGAVWQVTGSIYDPDSNKTTVHFDRAADLNHTAPKEN